MKKNSRRNIMKTIMNNAQYDVFKLSKKYVAAVEKSSKLKSVTYKSI